MSAKTFRLALLMVALPVSAAQAQYGGSPPPLYPYAVQNGYGVQTAQPYAVQVAPNTYVIQRPEPQRNYPYVGARKRAAAPAHGKFDRPHKPVDRALVDELRTRAQKKSADQGSAEPAQKSTVNKTKIVRLPPTVRETTRYVDDPPRVIDQITVDNSEETPNRGLLTQPRRSAPRATGSVELPAPSPDKGPRTIAADAEVTILGPDRMTIKLFRKGQGPLAKASD
ncbi:MAG TPA: hypothetical protein VGM57_16440 [Pseudolabrys sp.]|jgi:hypothetical protein